MRLKVNAAVISSADGYGRPEGESQEPFNWQAVEVEKDVEGVMMETLWSPD